MKKIALVLTFVGIFVICMPDSHAQRGDAANGATLYSQNCATCHGASGGGVTGPSLIDCSLCDSLLSLYEKINAEMPQGNPDACVDDCAWDSAAYIYETFNLNTYTAPTANAGSDQTVQVGDIVTLDGSGSSDSVTGIWTYFWEQTDGPSVSLSTATTVSPTFTAPDVSTSGTTLTFQLTVTNNGGVTGTDQVIITVNMASGDGDSGGAGCFIATGASKAFIGR